MKGKLIVIEGLDGCGKQTQTDELIKKLRAEGRNVISVTFPDYESDASIPVRMYLNGEFGEKASEVSPYMASVFYAVDRVASYKKVWGSLLENGTIVVADRYTTSNMIHQGSKLKGADRDDYWDWLADFEYNKLGLPVPNEVIYLEMPSDYSANLRNGREQKFSGTDIHERDSEYLSGCAEAAAYIAKKFNWKRVECVADGKLRSIEDIANEVYSYAKALL